MRVELLYADACPSWQEAGARLDVALERLGVEASIEYRKLESDADAAALPFGGSPTILVDGVDLFPGTRSLELACRVYPTSAGIKPFPTVEQFVDALARRASSAAGPRRTSA